MSVGGMRTYFKSRLLSKGRITVPSKVRALLNLEEGDNLVFIVKEDGYITVEKLPERSLEQAWFWSERWQKMEREAQEDIDEGRLHRYADADEAIESLERKTDTGGRNDRLI